MARKKPAGGFDLSAGEYRTLRRPRGQPAGAYDATRRIGESLARRSARSIAEGLDPVPASEAGPLEWYERAVFHRTRSRVRMRGSAKNPRAEIETREIKVTAGMVVGGGALILGWEIGMSIAHGLAGLDPLNWVSDIEDWINGTEQPGNVATTTVGGMIQAHIVEAFGGSSSSAPPPTPTTSPGSIIATPPSSSSGSGGSGVAGTPPVTLPFPWDPLL